jgi:hypothetical protein
MTAASASRLLPSMSAWLRATECSKAAALHGPMLEFGAAAQRFGLIVGKPEGHRHACSGITIDTSLDLYGPTSPAI